MCCTVTRNRASRRLPTPRRTCRQWRISIRALQRDHEYKRHGTLSLLAGYRALRDHPVPLSEGALRAIGPRSMVIDDRTRWLWLPPSINGHRAAFRKSPSEQDDREEQGDVNDPAAPERLTSAPAGATTASAKLVPSDAATPPPALWLASDPARTGGKSDEHSAGLASGHINRFRAASPSVPV